MFAVIAFICFLLHVAKVNWDIDLIGLGLMFLALELVVRSFWPTYVDRVRR